MRKLFILVLLVPVAYLALSVVPTVNAGAPINPRVFEQIARDSSGETDFLILMSTKSDLSKVATISDRSERKVAVAATLSKTATVSQAPLIRVLVRLQSEGQVKRYRTFFSVNAIAARGRQGAIIELARLPGVASIEPVGSARILGTFVKSATSPSLTTVEPNITQIRADQAWALGFTGTGILVANIDTGVRHTHEALKAGYKCRTLVSHVNCWYDAVSSQTVPYDDHGHGTHVMGTIAGRKNIGVAKSAKWVACRAFGQSGGGTVEDIIECSDFFLSRPGPYIPDVINNSWGAGPGTTIFNGLVDAWNAAGIHSTFAIGNSGPSCSTSWGPGEYINAFGMGAVDSADVIADFSSRGPASQANGGTIKPEIVAPGLSIRSSTNTSDTSYAYFSGTSMASPHGAGAMALMLSKEPNLSVSIVRSLSENTAVSNLDLTCGGSPTDNNIYGKGRLDALAASRNAHPRIFVADSNNFRIVRVDDMKGSKWTTLGSGGCGMGINEFCAPNGVFVDASDRIHIVDAGRHQILRANDMTGNGWMALGTPGNGMGQFSTPRGIVLDVAGRIYVADSANHRIVRMNDISGAGWTTFGTFGTGTGQFSSPHSIALDSNGRIYVTDTGNNRIVLINDLTGAGWTTFGTAGAGVNQFNTPIGIAVTIDGGIYVTDTNNHRLVRISDISGAGWATFGMSTQFGSPSGIAVDMAGRIYVSDLAYHQIARVNGINGDGFTKLGGNGCGIGTKQFCAPAGINVR